MRPIGEKLRRVRTIHAAMLLTCVLYIPVGELVGPKEAKDVRLLLMVLGFVGLADLGTAMLLRAQTVGAAEEILRRNPADPAALQQWQTGHILFFALCQSVAILGVVSRLLGATLTQTLPFAGACVVMMLVWSPRQPE